MAWNAVPHRRTKLKNAVTVQGAGRGRHWWRVRFWPVCSFAEVGEAKAKQRQGLALACSTPALRGAMGCHARTPSPPPQTVARVTVEVMRAEGGDPCSQSWTSWKPYRAAPLAPNPPTRQRGFTLIELLIALARHGGKWWDDVCWLWRHRPYRGRNQRTMEQAEHVDRQPVVGAQRVDGLRLLSRQDGGVLCAFQRQRCRPDSRSRRCQSTRQRRGARFPHRPLRHDM